MSYIHNKTLINIKIPISNFIIKLLPKKPHNKAIKVSKYVERVLVPSWYIKLKNNNNETKIEHTWKTTCTCTEQQDETKTEHAWKNNEK